MLKKPLYLVAYDITWPSRMSRMCRMVKDYAFGRQKSVYECYVTAGTLNELIHRAESIVDVAEDSVVVCRIPSPSGTLLLGSATMTTDYHLIKIS